MLRSFTIAVFCLSSASLIGCGNANPAGNGGQSNDGGSEAATVPETQPVYPDVLLTISGDQGGGGGYMWDGEPGKYEFLFGEVSTKNQVGKELTVAVVYKGTSEVGEVYDITCTLDGEQAMKTNVLFAGKETDLIPAVGWKITLKSEDRE